MFMAAIKISTYIYTHRDNSVSKLCLSEVHRPLCV